MTEPTCAVECECHVNPYDYVPCCRIHLRPLRAAEAGHGECSWSREGLEAHVGGLERVTRSCGAFAPEAWLWLPRDHFDARDLPPANGETPPRLPSVGSPWAVILHACGECQRQTPHVEGQHRRICTRCGTAQWVPSPQYGTDFKDVV